MSQRKHYFSFFFFLVLFIGFGSLKAQNTTKVPENLDAQRIKYPSVEHKPVRYSVSKTLDSLLQDMSIKMPRMIVCRDGDSYAISVYSTKYKVRAIAARKQLFHRFPKLKLFLSYHKSRYRIKIAHFETLAEVEKVLVQVKSDFPKAFIIPWLKRD